MTEKTIYKIGGAGCGACILKIKNIVEPLAGVDEADFDLKQNILTVKGKHKHDDVILAMSNGKFSADLIVE